MRSRFIATLTGALLADHDETKSPRMIAFNRGVAFAMETGLGWLAIDSVTDTYVGVTPLGTPLQPSQLVLDMKTARLNGQADMYKDDLIFLTNDNTRTTLNNTINTFFLINSTRTTLNNAINTIRTTIGNNIFRDTFSR